MNNVKEASSKTFHLSLSLAFFQEPEAKIKISYETLKSCLVKYRETDCTQRNIAGDFNVHMYIMELSCTD